MISGALTLPADLTLNDDCSCGDITVRVSKTADGMPAGSETVQAQGDIATGSCDYTITVPAGTFLNWHWLGATVRPIRFTECGDDAVEITFDGASLGALFGLGGTIRQDMQASASCN